MLQANEKILRRLLNYLMTSLKRHIYHNNCDQNHPIYKLYLHGPPAEGLRVMHDTRFFV